MVIVLFYFTTHTLLVLHKSWYGVVAYASVDGMGGFIIYEEGLLVCNGPISFLETFAIVSCNLSNWITV